MSMCEFKTGIQKELVLSLSDCYSTIQNYLHSNDFQVLNYEVHPFSESVNGFMGDHLLIKIKYESQNFSKEIRFFAKRFPYQHESHKIYALSLGAFPNEIFTYSVLFNEFKKFPGFSDDFAPKYYYGKNDLLLFEDLSVQGYVLPSTPNEMLINEIEKGLELLAKYHCGSIGYQEMKSKELNRRYRLIEDYQHCMQEPLFRKDEEFLGYRWFKARFSALIALIDQSPNTWGIATKEFKEKLKLLADRSFEIIKPNAKFYNVLSHGDMWAKNMMIRYKENAIVDCKLIDFQLQRYCPPAHDVLQFLYLAMSVERRKHHLHALLSYYYECLRREVLKGDLILNDIISYDDFELTVNYLLPQIKLQTAYYTAFQGACPEFHKYIKSNPKEFKKWVFEDGAPFAVESFKTDSNYRKIVTEAIIELKDVLTDQ